VGSKTIAPHTQTMDLPVGMWRALFVVVSVKETMGQRSENAELNVSFIKALWLEAFGLSKAVVDGFAIQVGLMFQ
jgi:hypothetical protein